MKAYDLHLDVNDLLLNGTSAFYKIEALLEDGVKLSKLPGGLTYAAYGQIVNAIGALELDVDAAKGTTGELAFQRLEEFQNLLDSVGRFCDVVGPFPAYIVSYSS